MGRQTSAVYTLGGWIYPGVMSVSSTTEKIILLFVSVPISLLYVLVIVLTYVGFFDFLYSWPLVLSYLFFLLLTVLIHEFSLNISYALIFSLIIKERRCTRRFLRLVCTSETPKTGPEGLGKMRHVKYRVADTLLFSVGIAVFPFADSC